MDVFWFWILLIFLLLAVAAWPIWPYAQRWGYAPSLIGVAGFLIIIVMFWIGLLVVWWPWVGYA